MVSRRELLRLGALSAASLTVPSLAAAGLRIPYPPPRSLSIYNLHTDEKLSVVYWEGGRYLPEALAQIDYIMRDYRANAIKPIKRGLLDLLVRIKAALDTHSPFNLISGYRTPETNAMLHSRNEGVAPHSLHIEAMAADIAVPGLSLATLHSVAVALGGGGVGYYPRSDFVHVDIGKIRYW
ncbi:MAG TPA: DUF882 domain-containing protein [Candidatus Binataceae bacterium]|jgi:uncharacterized protein YcbK (DUF882 family)